MVTINGIKLKLDRTLSRGLWSQVGLLAILMVVAFVVANILMSLSPTNWEYFCNKHHISRWVAPLYLLIDGNAFTSVYQDPSPATKWTIILSCIIYIIGIFLFTGMMVSVMTNIIERRVEKHRSGLVSYLKEGHYIIMGYDDTIPSFISYIFDKDPGSYVLILSSRPSHLVHEKLLKSFSEKQLDRVIINYGHRTSPETYPIIHLESAKEVFIVGYSGKQSHDPINIECVDAIYDYLAGLSGNYLLRRITCVFKDLDTYAAFKTSDIFKKLGKLNLEFVPYNYSVGWARRVLLKRCYSDWKDVGKHEPYPYPSVFRGGISYDDKHFVHLVFVGTTNVAVAFAAEAAHLLHFPNFIRDSKLKTRITFIDINADKEKDEFITRNRHFFEVQPYLYRDLTTGSPEKMDKEFYIGRGFIRADEGMQEGVDYGFLDVQFQFIKGDVFSREVQDLLDDWARDMDNQYLSIFLALAEQRTNFVMAMNMPDSIYDNNIPIFIRQRRSDNLVTNLREADIKTGTMPYARLDGEEVKIEDRQQRYSNIYPFGMDETVFYTEEVALKRAKLINYLYETADYSTSRFTDVLVLDATPDKEIWEEADRRWHPLPVALKWSNLYNAYSLDAKLTSLRAMRKLEPDDNSQDFWNLSEEEIKRMAEVEHNRWNVEKLLMGFRKPTMEEDAYSVDDKDEDAKKRLQQNKKLKIHHDIRPFSKLDDVKKLDFEFSRYIPWILRMTAD